MSPSSAAHEGGNEQVTPETEPNDGARFRRAGSGLYVFALPTARN